jgi:ethanolaminephosphotransferase
VSRRNRSHARDTASPAHRKFCGCRGARRCQRKKKKKKKKNHPRPPRLSHSPPSPARPAHSTAAVNYLPTWLAPNLITLAGLAVLTGAYAVTAAHAPALEAAAPRWVYALMGAATFIYLHLDVLDGKQARRTGSSSPLGQLFDHGCDALAVHLLIVGIGASIDTGLTAKAVLGQLAVMAPWIAAHWEEYHSGHIRYGNGWWGVTEANYVLIALHTVTACAGPGVWRASAPGLAARVGLDPTFPALPPRLAAVLSTWVGTDLLLVGIVSAGVFQVSGPLWRVLVSRRDAPLAPGLAGAKQLGRGAAARHAAHLALLLGLGAAAMMEPIRAGRADWHVRVVFGSFGIVYALEVSGRWRARGGEGDERERERGRACPHHAPGEREKKKHTRTPTTHPSSPLLQASKLIMDHMAKEPFEPAWWPLAALGAGIANSAGGDGASGLVAPPPAFDSAVLALVAAGYLHYVLGVISETCAYLGIQCLTIKPVVAAAGNGGGGGGGRAASKAGAKPKKVVAAKAAAPAPAAPRSRAAAAKPAPPAAAAAAAATVKATRTTRSTRARG